ncbi:DUF4198 domain-containing protein [Acinetobacter sp. WZC-1]|uniref:DUF4198 domain-containing protein n=1 Tax=Acinetobacter sp. WZC-1 TaxID=3459034 RepID=UPI00403D83CC
MKKFLLFTSTLISTVCWAHEPYVAPLAYLTKNTQIPIISGFAEHTFSSEYALREPSFIVVTPTQKSTTIKPETALKSVTVFDLPLPEEGTYAISSRVSFPLKYALHNKVWKEFHEVSAEQAGPIADRPYLIPDDFKKGKAPQPESVTREWTIQSYVSKNKTSAIAEKTDTALNVSFSVHPNEIRANTPVSIRVLQNSQQPVQDAQIRILVQGGEEDKAIQTATNTEGVAQVQFPTTGQYIVEVTRKTDPGKKPENQYYTIISLQVAP